MEPVVAGDDISCLSSLCWLSAVLDCFVAVPGVGRVLDCLEIKDDDWFSQVICWVVFWQELVEYNFVRSSSHDVFYLNCITNWQCCRKRNELQQQTLLVMLLCISGF